MIIISPNAKNDNHFYILFYKNQASDPVINTGQESEDRMAAHGDQLPMYQRSQVQDLMGAQELELVLSFKDALSSAATNSYYEQYL